jgi:hypothetical protein
MPEWIQIALTLLGIFAFPWVVFGFCIITAPGNPDEPKPKWEDRYR